MLWSSDSCPGAGSATALRMKGVTVNARVIEPVLNLRAIVSEHVRHVNHADESDPREYL